jgi:hypothetical protein
VTARESVPRHDGTYFATRSSRASDPSRTAMPTRVLVTDFVTENTSRGWRRGVPQFHSPTRRPLRTTA